MLEVQNCRILLHMLPYILGKGKILKIGYLLLRESLCRDLNVLHLLVGGEVRIASDSSVTHAAIACQGASLKNDTKSLLTAGVLQVSTCMCIHTPCTYICGDKYCM